MSKKIINKNDKKKDSQIKVSNTIDFNRNQVAKLFKRRTGIKYQNWLQAWGITENQKKNESKI